ncbi:hypothetical protein [Aliivibrio fischeri]|uniref:hypothetical protein n=1 Tax=Aliivibrio fischeri TaxID=668 RepID=UPI0012DA0654|nr:hypothetical protein [Aliivibrio fischeri]MUL17324.1 hypothetical protein [Aliivibrio fischeri]
MNSKKISSQIDAIKKAQSKNIDHEIHVEALKAVNHLRLHGDLTLADKLYNEMPRGKRRQQLANWFVKYTNLEFYTKELRQKQKVSPNRIFWINKQKNNNADLNVIPPWFSYKSEKTNENTFDIIHQFNNLKKRTKDALDRNLPLVGGTKEEINLLLKNLGLLVIKPDLSEIDLLNSEIDRMHQHLPDEEKDKWQLINEELEQGIINQDEAKCELIKIKVYCYKKERC